MPDDRNGVPPGPPSPFGRARGTNGVHGDVHADLPTRSLSVDVADGPTDLVAVQADDELVNALGSGAGVAFGDRAPGSDPDPRRNRDEHLVAMLAAWRAEIEAEPIPELLDLDTAVAAVAAGVAAETAVARRRRSSRLRHLAPLAAAAAIIVATVSGVGLGSQNAQPGDALWSVQKVLNSERAESVEAKVTIETRLASVRTALAEGDTATAARELDAIRAEIPAVRGQDGRNQLVEEQEFLAAKLADTEPGTPADLSTAPTSTPNARPTGGAAPAPASSATPPAKPSETGTVGSMEPTAPSPSAPEGQDRDAQDLSGVPVVPPEPGTGGPTASDPDASADPRSSAPEVTREPGATPSGPAADAGPGSGTGSVDPTTAPGPATVPGGGPGGTVGGSAPVGSGSAPSDTTTASASAAGTSVDVTATATAN